MKLIKTEYDQDPKVFVLPNFAGINYRRYLSHQTLSFCKLELQPNTATETEFNDCCGCPPTQDILWLKDNTIIVD